VDVKTGIMQRPERIVYLGVGSIFSPLFAYLFGRFYDLPPDFLTIAALVWIACLTILGAIYRTQYVLIHLDPNPQDNRLFRRFVMRWVRF